MAKKASAETVNLKPLDDRLVVSVSDATEKTAGGILLPDMARQKPQQGTVIAVGPGRMLDNGTRAPMAVVVGDTVLFGKYSGSDVEVHNVEYKILRESDVLGKLGK